MAISMEMAQGTLGKQAYAEGTIWRYTHTPSKRYARPCCPLNACERRDPMSSAKDERCGKSGARTREIIE